MKCNIDGCIGHSYNELNHCQIYKIIKDCEDYIDHVKKKKI